MLSKNDAGAALEGLAELVRWRRDVRRFRADPVPASTVDRLLRLADHAPSVGNSQPWRILSVESAAVRADVRANFEAQRVASGSIYQGDRADLYVRLKLAGFDNAPVHLAVFCDGGTAQGDGLGQQTMPQALDQSCTCMITVLWLAARAAGLGLGWVSILDAASVSRTLRVPDDWRLVGYLLMGWPEEDSEVPDLERAGWQARTPFETRYRAVND